MKTMGVSSNSAMTVSLKGPKRKLKKSKCTEERCIISYKSKEETNSKYICRNENDHQIIQKSVIYSFYYLNNV
jgi:hypothetical protein